MSEQRVALVWINRADKGEQPELDSVWASSDEATEYAVEMFGQEALDEGDIDIDTTVVKRR